MPYTSPEMRCTTSNDEPAGGISTPAMWHNATSGTLSVGAGANAEAGPDDGLGWRLISFSNVGHSRSFHVSNINAAPNTTSNPRLVAAMSLSFCQSNFCSWKLPAAPPYRLLRPTFIPANINALAVKSVTVRSAPHLLAITEGAATPAPVEVLGWMGNQSTSRFFISSTKLTSSTETSGMSRWNNANKFRKRGDGQPATEQARSQGGNQ